MKLQEMINRNFRFSKFLLHKIFQKDNIKFRCPFCNYFGFFLDDKPTFGVRKYAICPMCGSQERHRLQKLVMDTLSKQFDFSIMKILHFAPEAFLKKYLESKFKEYSSADLFMKNVDFKADLRKLPFPDNKYDFVFASHVLEHIKEDDVAISEIKRVLQPNGIAILPVPIVAEATIEYPKANPFEANHVRAPGFDYYDRYLDHFSRVERYNSDDFDPIFQTYIYEKRDNWPTKQMPYKKAMYGEKHTDIVPACFV